MEQQILVGDIGGTNVRLALSGRETGALSEIRTYLCADYPTPAAVLQAYGEAVGGLPKEACLAIACPVQGDHISMTNHTWEFSVEQTRQILGLEKLNFINDYTALSMSVPVLGDDDKVQLSSKGEAQPHGPIAIYGPGTGLGVAHLVWSGDKWLSIPGEGGHSDFAPHSELQDKVLKQLRKRFGHVSHERILSGPGLANVYEALCMIEGVEAEVLKPSQITELGLSDRCPICKRTLEIFCAVLGSFGGNLALSMGLLVAFILQAALFRALSTLLRRARSESSLIVKDASTITCPRSQPMRSRQSIRG